MEISQNKTEKVKLDFKDSKYATGKRKTSIAVDTMGNKPVKIESVLEKANEILTSKL